MAQLRNTTIDDTTSLRLPVGTTAQRPASPLAGMIRYNTTLQQTEYYNGTNWRSVTDTFPEATGGTIVDTDIGGIPYRIHYFTTVGSSNFVVSVGGEVDVLIVGGGGGSGGGGNTGYHGGGGGGGGVVYRPNFPVTAGTIAITVGAGGTAGAQTGDSGFRGGNGGNSSFSTLIANGGGGGGGNAQAGGANGGSGGGGNLYSGAGGTSNQSTYTGAFVYGNSGGTGQSDYGSAGGGGGAGGPGLNGRANIGGQGGPGLANAITGISLFYGGGGSGAGNTTNGPSVAGSTAAYTSGLPNTGQGGGGRQSVPGLPGGSGIVIVRYRRNLETSTAPSRTDISTVPAVSTAGVERQLVSRIGLLTYLDAGNIQSYSGSGTTWTDLSPNGWNGTLIDGVTFTTQSEGALTFNGNNQYIDIPNGGTDRFSWAPNNSVGNNAMSFEMWVRSTDADGRYFSRPWNGSGQYNYWLTATDLYVTAGSTGASTSAFSTLATGQWEYVCGIITPTQFAVYRNGVIASNFANHGVSGGVPSAGNPNQSLALMTLYPYGSWAGNTSFSVGGDVAIFRAYNRVLSAAEVATHYAAERWRFGR